MNCPVCAWPGGDYRREVGDYSIVKCACCGLEYTDPIPSQKELWAFYETYQDQRAPLKVVEENAARNALTLRGLARGRCLDFGCGPHNAFVQAWGDGVGIDIKDDLPDEQFDLITMWGVLEHLATPLATMAALKTRLKPGGTIALTTVNAEGDIPYTYKPPEHLTYWTETAMRMLFAAARMNVFSYANYAMAQREDIYFGRVLSRTPVYLANSALSLINPGPDLFVVPTNECFVVAQ